MENEVRVALDGGRPSGVLRTTSWEPAPEPDEPEAMTAPPIDHSTPEGAVELAVARGWKQVGSGNGEFQWQSREGDTSPTFPTWDDAKDWMAERIRADLGH
jgi:hypothetical protein